METQNLTYSQTQLLANVKLKWIKVRSEQSFLQIISLFQAGTRDSGIKPRSLHALAAAAAHPQGTREFPTADSKLCMDHPITFLKYRYFYSHFLAWSCCSCMMSKDGSGNLLQVMRQFLEVNLLTCVTFYVFHFKDSASQDVQVLVTVQDCSGDFELDLNLPNTFQGVIMFKCRIVRRTLFETCM